jgi:pimeloyl-ACP methyl ester carboxylesterase
VPLLPIALFLLALGAIVGAAAGGVFAVWFGGTWLRFHRYHRHKGLPTPDGATWGDRVRAWMREAGAIASLLLFKAELGPRALPRPGDLRPPVLCIHGFTQDRTNFSAIRGSLWRAGRSSIAVDLGLPGRAPTRYAPALADRLADLWRAWPEGPVDLICHSMGGLLLREVLAARPELRARVGTVLTLGSPHGGTAASRGPLRLWPEAAGLHRRSPWIEALPTLAALAPQARVITVAGTADYVVYPAETCHLEGSEAITLPGVGHAGLLIDERVLALVGRTFTPTPSAP